MIQRFTIHVTVVLLMGLLLFPLSSNRCYGSEMASSGPTQGQRLITTLLTTWSLINTARSIARQDALIFHESICMHLLDIFAILDALRKEKQSTSIDIATIDKALYCVTNGLGALYIHIPHQEYLGSTLIIKKIGSVWSLYKEAHCYTAEQSGILSPDFHHYQ